jgi:hypothetical protein
MCARFFLDYYVGSDVLTIPEAKKEENPEEALKEFRAIVDQEAEKGDWSVIAS